MCANPNFFATSTTTTPAADSQLVHGCLDERTLRPLPVEVLPALPITAQEQQSGVVFALNTEHYSEATPDAQCVARLAVCRLVSHLEWGNIEPSTPVIYTETFQFPADEQNGVPSLVSHIGTVLVSDGDRELLYTSTWVGHHDQRRSHEYGDLYEIWQVLRFVYLR